MARLIDAAALMVDVAHRNALDVIPGADFERIWLYSTIQLDMFNIVRSAPTIDAVPVVRCKDCKNRGTSYACPYRRLVFTEAEGYHYEDVTLDDSFCSFGERKEDAPCE